MPNSSLPFGFLPFGHIEGSAPTQGLERFFINSSNAHLIFTGDVVMPSSEGGRHIDMWLSSAPTVVLGVFAGCEYFSPQAGRTVWSRWWPGSVGTNATTGLATAWVITDPEMLFLAASGSSVPFATTDIGYNCTMVTSQSSLGNQISGQSAMILSTATSTTATNPWHIEDLYSNVAPYGAAAPGADATTGYNWVVVRPQNWFRQAGQVAWSS